MSASDAVRMAIAKAGIKQTELSKIWGTSPQAIYNKLNLERWTARDLAQIAKITGGRLAFIYPDGQEILIQAQEAEEAEKPEEPEKPKATKPKKASAEKKAAPKKAPAQKKDPAKKVKEPEQIEEQISFFE